MLCMWARREVISLCAALRIALLRVRLKVKRHVLSFGKPSQLAILACTALLLLLCHV